jgi:hypothetical protein
MVGDPHLGAVGERAVVERAVGAEVVPVRAVGGLPQVVGSGRIDLLTGLLRCVPGAGQTAVQEGGSQLLAEEGPAVLAPTQYCLRFGWAAAKTMPRAATSGW